ncbi:RidA family protein [Polyangium jinanense]|uniref:RidA family protein n=1 Tax=Polyangium jinanense TaxID=2829994 RepID=A0A9X4ART5_9BACT|nr:RidA family protein [Polyangium jinanense]MDC3954213.1 RidA family protein [Polyangium jinanense]MDC3981831.1 RidA family protein [Polyangium jinanense]
MNDKLTFVNPEGFLPPKGYSNGALVSGPTLFVAGQVGWNARCEFETDDLAEQFAQALDNVIAVVRAAGGSPTDLAKMTVYVTDLDAYRGSLKAIGQAWRTRLGKHFPAMALLGVAGLVEPRAKVEIEAVAVLRGAQDPA